MQNKLWTYTDTSSNNEEISSLESTLSVSKKIAKLLIIRGVKTFEQAKQFFRPSIETIPDPFLMKNMELAVSRLVTAVQSNQMILVYGDYDVDGTSSVTILYKFLVQHSENVMYYIPNRYKEGYGISKQGIDFAIDNEIDLILTLDCGIKAHKNIQYAKDNNMDVIVCDHHLPENTLPNAIVLNPKQEGCAYPFKDLAGVGVTYKLIQGYCQREKLPDSEYLRFLDFVALGTGADLVPLQGENRAYVYHGLEKINTNPSRGIQSIVEVAKCKSPIVMKDIGFSIGPRINAAGRIGDASRIVDLFIAGDSKLEKELSKEISEENLYRRELDQQSTEEALSYLYSQVKETHANVAFNATWNKGIIGIVASRVLDKIYKPTIIFTQSGDLLTGSARSIQGFNIHDAISNCSEHVESFGGHAFAAGMTVKTESLTKFKEAFEKQCSNISKDQLTPLLPIDLDINFYEMDSKFFRILWQFEPFGMLNPNPVFSTTQVKLKSKVTVMGTKHIRFTVYQENDPDNSFDVVGFNKIEHYENIQSGKLMTICYEPELNHWMGRSQIQLNLRDIKFQD